MNGCFFRHCYSFVAVVLLEFFVAVVLLEFFVAVVVLPFLC